MTDLTPKLASGDIEVDERELTATATFIFPDGVRFPIVITKRTLNHWAGSGGPWEMRAAVLKRSSTLAKVAASARQVAAGLVLARTEVPIWLRRRKKGHAASSRD